MSIVALTKVTAYGHIADKARVLEDLQGMGCLHLVSLNPEAEISRRGGPTSEAREVLRFLLDCRQRRKQVRDPARFSEQRALEIEHKALELKHRIQELEDERDFLLARIERLRPWGDFSFPPREDLGQYRLWFYLVPHYKMADVEATDLIWETVQRDHRFCYVVVVSQNEPEGMPAARIRTGNQSLSTLEQRLEEVEIQLEDLQAERSSLTRWCELYARNLNRLEDVAARDEAAQQTYDAAPIFALQAWAPKKDTERLQNYAREHGVGIEFEEPGPDDHPPTLLETPPKLESGKDLVLFYMTPGYRMWDPSTVVFFSFALFFAMILSDAAYAALMGLGVALFWKRMGRSDFGRRFRVLLAVLLGLSVVWGVLIGSYFGLTPPSGYMLASFKIFDINDYNQMMQISIVLGLIHLMLANGADAWRQWHSLAKFGPLGWILMLFGGGLLWFSAETPQLAAGFSPLAIGMMGVGAVGVLLFSSVDPVWWKRLLGGLQGLMRITSAFGDTLSYLRLFALGLAGASLSMTFNQLGRKVDTAIPGIGMLFAILLVVFGHSLNLLLTAVSGVIHGLRLNFIEFFNWSLSGEGYLFKAFNRKEQISWKA